MSAWDLSCPDWEVRLKSCRPPIREDLPLWPEGDRAVAIFKKLRLADVPGNPTMAEAGDEWIFAIVRALFGSLDPVTRSRMIRELFLLVPKKNSKTTYGALIMVTALLVNERPSAPFIMTAPVQDVAELAFEAALEGQPFLELGLAETGAVHQLVLDEVLALVVRRDDDEGVLAGRADHLTHRAPSLHRSSGPCAAGLD